MLSKFVCHLLALASLTSASDRQHEGPAPLFFSYPQCWRTATWLLLVFHSLDFCAYICCPLPVTAPCIARDTTTPWLANILSQVLRAWLWLRLANLLPYIYGGAHYLRANTLCCDFIASIVAGIILYQRGLPMYGLRLARDAV